MFKSTLKDLPKTGLSLHPEQIFVWTAIWTGSVLVAIYHPVGRPDFVLFSGVIHEPEKMLPPILAAIDHRRNNGTT